MTLVRAVSSNLPDFVGGSSVNPLGGSTALKMGIIATLHCTSHLDTVKH